MLTGRGADLIVIDDPLKPEERPNWAPADKAVVENLRELLRAP